MHVECPHILFNNSTFLSEFYMQEILKFSAFMQKKYLQTKHFFLGIFLVENYAENLRILCRYINIYSDKFI